jgi:oligoribonuclease NrnB/cAMP/cGMP phosphodiesterase (DHH superfamily)
MNKPLVIYHGKCIDGFTGAWAFWRKFKESFDYHPGQYGHKPPDTFDRDVYLVDFSYKRGVVEDIILTANKVWLLDHHATAIDDLWDLKGLNTTFSNINESGAMIAWKFVAAITGDSKKPPEMLLHVQDRDLWLFKLANTRELNEYMFSQEYDFLVWEEMMTMSKHQRNKAITAGEAIVRKHFKDINELLGQMRRKMLIGDHLVDVACLPYMMASDAGSMMSLTAPFAATYYDTKDHRCFSLRSNANNPNAVDVSVIAANYGGGGHKHAAGFKVTRMHGLAML